MSEQAQPQRTQIALWLVVTALFLGVSLSTYGSFQLGVYQDDAAYVVLARSLVSGARYGMINAPGAPTPAIFPFGYPLLLAPFAYFFPSQPDLMHWLSLAATLLNGALLFWKWRAFSPGTSHWWGLSVTALYLLSPLTVGHSQMVMSEAVFTSLVLATLVLVSPLQPAALRLVHIAALSVLLVLVVFSRTIGITLVGALLLFWLVRYRRRALLPLGSILLGMVLVTGILVAVTVIEPIDLLPGRYLQELDRTPDKARPADSPKPSIGFNVQEYTTAYLREVVLPFGTGGTAAGVLNRLGLPWLLRVTGFSVTLLIALGAWRWLKKEGIRLPLFFGVLYLLTLYVWTWPLPRLLYPIQPQLFLAFLWGLVTLAAFLARRIPAVVTRHVPTTPLVKYAAVAFVLVVLGGMELYVTARGESTLSQIGDVTQRTAWLRTHAAPEAVVVTQYPHIDYIYGGHKTLPYDTDLNTTPNAYIIVAPRVRWRDDDDDPEGTQVRRNMLAQLQAREQAHTASLVYQDTLNQILIYHLAP